MTRLPTLLALACLALSILLGTAACERRSEEVPSLEWDFERMVEQRRYDAYEATDLFPDGAVMRPPPEGTVPRERRLGPPDLVDGVRSEALAATPPSEAPPPVEEIPMPLDRRVLRTGRHHFLILCAACHGRSGDGVSPVAEVMELRRPPSLLTDRAREMPAGRIYRVLRDGYGLMPAYGGDLTVEQRWAVVAYVRALQLSRRMPVDLLGPDARERLEEVAGPAGERSPFGEELGLDVEPEPPTPVETPAEEETP